MAGNMETIEAIPLWPVGEGDGQGHGYGYGPMEERPKIKTARVPGAGLKERMIWS